MVPAAALERIVYLLDRSLAPTPKVRAFLRAREVVEEIGPERLAELHRTKSLKDLPGIGDATGTVIAEALDGEVPSYLSKLEDTTVIPVGEGGEIRAALRGDCHSHSLWSDGGAPIESMARTAIALGHEYLVLTDHSPRLTIAHGLSRERLLQQLDEIERLNAELAPFRILTGIEVDILEDGALDQDEDDAGAARRGGGQRALQAAHARTGDDPTHGAGGVQPARRHPRPLHRAQGGRHRSGASHFDADLVFAACARFETAVEINCRPERQDPPEELLSLALDWGCKISIDTDAHAPGQLEWQPYGCDKAARCEVPVDDIVNTWPAEELIAWAGSHPSD